MPAQSSEIRLRELELRRARLDHEYELAQAGLKLGKYGLGAAVLASTITIAGAIAALALGNGLFSGTQLVILFSVIVVAIIVYYSFVFGRLLKIRVAISEVEREIEIEAGRTTR